MNATQLKVVSVFTPLLLSMSISSAIAVPVPGGTLDPLAIPKYVSPLVIPPVLYDDGGAALNASIALRPAFQEILPNTGCGAASTAHHAAGGPAIDCTGTDGFPSTHLWAYGDPTRPSTFFNPSFTIEVTQNTTTTINWMNQLVADPVACQNIPAPTNEPVCNYLTHIIRDANGNPVVDQTLHWAAPNQNCRNGVTGPGGDTDCAGSSGAPYTGPIPMVTHVHGAHVGPVSDGYPEAWWLPNAVNIDCTNAAGYPATADTADDFDCNGTFYSDTASTVAGAGHAVYQYTNDQPTTTLWYHDHSLGITRLNVYAAGAGFWLIRTADDGESGVLEGTLPGPAPGTFATENPNADPAVRAAIREIPLAIQPKSFMRMDLSSIRQTDSSSRGWATGRVIPSTIR